METIQIEKRNGEDMKVGELNVQSTKWKTPNRKKLNGRGHTSSVKIRHYFGMKYSPPPASTDEPEYIPKYTDCEYFTIMSIRNSLEYAAIVKRESEIFCYIPIEKLSKPGMYKFEMPINGEKFEMFGNLKVYRIHIIEPTGM